MNIDKTSTLYVVATPIGNLEDMTPRAIKILKSVDRIAAEDTRHTGSLLKHFSISKPSISLHDYNERDRIKMILDYLQKGESIALVCDSGTPLISDPGFPLVQAAQNAGIKVVPIPGACAAITALSAAGIPSDSFIFCGFLPTQTKTRDELLTKLSFEKSTLIFYEAPHRLLKTLQALACIFKMRTAVVARELTKIYESILRAPLPELFSYYENHPDEVRGEIVILVAGARDETHQCLVNTEQVLRTLLQALPLKQAVALTSQITGGRKNEVYEQALKIKDVNDK